VIWETALEPWHVSYGGYASVLEGNRATFGSPRGWVHQFDLSTGKPLHDKKLEMGSITSLLDLGDGRILAVGFATSDLYAPPAAYVFDASFEPKQVALPTRGTTKGSFIFPRAVKVADNGIVIIGAGLPLSIYDAKDFSVRTTLDNQLGWNMVASRNEVLVASRSNVVKRFDVITNGQRDLGYVSASHVVSVEGGEVIRSYADRKYGVSLLREDKTKTELPGEITSIHDYDGKRFISTLKNELRIHEMPSGEIKKRIKLDDEAAYLSNLAVSGKRAVAVSRGVVRMIDLETGEVTPKATGSRQGGWLAVGNDGAVLSGDGSQMWTMTGGKASPMEPADELEAMRSDDPKHYVTAKRVVDGPATFEMHTFGDKTVKSITSETPVETAWIARDGSLILSSDGDERKQLMRAKFGGKPELMFAFNHDADILGVEADSEIMLVLDGRVAVVGQNGALVSTIRVPHCAPIYAYGALEEAGTRAATWDNKDLALWDRKTGKLLASAALGTNPEEVQFLPKRAEVLLRFDERLVFWTGKGLRALPWPGVHATAVSTDGKRLAVSFFDGRTGLYDLDALLAITPQQANFPAGEAIPETCGEADPLALPQPEPEDTHDDIDYDGGSTPDDD
jgi:hypothetical protein